VTYPDFDSRIKSTARAGTSAVTLPHLVEEQRAATDRDLLHIVVETVARRMSPESYGNS